MDMYGLLVDRIKELRFKVKDIRTKTPYNRIERRELLQGASSELLKAEKEYIASEVAKLPCPCFLYQLCPN